jgi:pimeloyl-ACP methyl ester carboxylesterase
VKALVLAPLIGGCATTTIDRADYASVHGLRMYYEEHGRGRPLVLLHGGGSTVRTTFGAILPKLARTHHVIAPEQQAHGHTAALLEQLGVHNADILGFSNAGMTALQLAIRHPALVRRLIICSGFYAHAGLVPTLWKGLAHASPANMPAPLREGYLAVAPHPEALPTFVMKTVAMLQSFDDIPEAAIRAIGAPTLVMIGDKDVILPEHAMQLARLVPHGDLAVLPGSARGAYLGAAEAAKPGSPLPDLAVAMIDSFLNQQ